MSGSKGKSSSDVADVAKKHQGRQEEEVTEEPKRFMMQEMTREFSLFEETLLVYKVQEPNIEKYTKIAAPVQNAIQHY